MCVCVHACVCVCVCVCVCAERRTGIAAAIPGEEGVAITELLLNALADPDARATEDDSFLNRTLVGASL